jgi:hypothetical protein
MVINSGGEKRELQPVGGLMRRIVQWLRSVFGLKPKAGQVPYYDIETETLCWIPKSELSRGVILVKMPSLDHPVYVEADKLKAGPVKHSELDPELRPWVEGIMHELADVRPLSYEEWEDGFRRDSNPAREIAGWHHLTAILKLLTERHSLTSNQRKECFRVLVACFTGGRDTVWERSGPVDLPPAVADEAIRYFFEGGYDTKEDAPKS